MSKLIKRVVDAIRPGDWQIVVKDCEASGMRECVAALRPEAEAPLCKLAPWGANRELPVGFLSREQLRGFGSIVR